MVFDPDKFITEEFDPDSFIETVSKQEAYTAPQIDFGNPTDALTPDEKSVVDQNLNQDQKDMITATNYYNARDKTNYTPEAVTANIKYEYGESATAATANEKNNIRGKYFKDIRTPQDAALALLPGELGKKIKDIDDSFFKRTAGGLMQAPTMLSEQAKIKDQSAKYVADKISMGNKDVSKVLHRYFKTVSASMGTAQSLVNLADESKPEVLDALQQYGANLVEQSGDIQSEHLSGKSFVELHKDGEHAQIGKDLATMIAFEVPNLVTQISLATLSSGLSLGFMGTTSAGAKRAEKTEDDSLSERVVAPIAVGAIEILTEKLIGTQSIIDRVTAGKIKTGFMNRIKQIAIDATTGSLSEGGAAFGENVVDRLSGEEVSLMRGVPEAMAVGAVMDATVGQMMTLGDANRIRKQNTDAEIDTLVEESKITPEQGEAVKAPESERESMLNDANEQLTQREQEEQAFAEEAMGTAAKIRTPEGRPAQVVKDEVLDDTGATIEQELEQAETPKEMSQIAKNILAGGEKVKGALEQVASITTRIRGIDPQVALTLDSMEQFTHITESESKERVSEFVDTAKEVIKNTPRAERDTLFSEILNRDEEALNKRGIKGVEELSQFLEEVRQFYDAESIQDYFPREVTKYKKLAKHLGTEPKGIYDQAIKERSQELDRELTDTEKQQVIAKVNRLGFKGKKRAIDKVTPDLAQFYENPLDTLERHIRAFSQKKARKKFLGVEAKDTSEVDVDGISQKEEEVEYEKAISKIVQESIEERGLSDYDKQQQLAELLRSRITMKGSPKWVETYRRLSGLKHVTKVRTLVKQVGDVAVSVGENGLMNVATTPEQYKQWSDELENDVKISLEAIGVAALDQNLSKEGLSAIEKALFEPLHRVDKWGKETILLRSTVNNWRNLANNNPEKLAVILNKKLGIPSMTDKIISDLKNGMATQDVKLALYVQMGAFHPISHSEHIKFYADHPSARPLLFLTSFAFKRYDRLYRESLKDIVEGSAEYAAGAVDNDSDMKSLAADKIASGTVGMSKFIVFSVIAEVMLTELYEGILRALKLRQPKDENEKWFTPYIEEFIGINPLVDPYAIRHAWDRKDPIAGVKKYLEPIEFLGTDVAQSLTKIVGKMLEDQPIEDITDWKKDIPFAGEFMVGKDRYEDAIEN